MAFWFSDSKMKRSYLAMAIIGILFILFGMIFALQGNGNIGGSAMTGVSFWIYAGSGIAVVGLALTALGVYFGSRTPMMRQPMNPENPSSTQTGS